MALSAAFKERLDHMEFTRNQRLALLQAEKELQVNKSQILASKLRNIRYMERRCLKLDQMIASQNFKISVLKSENEDLSAKFQTTAQNLRTLKSEVEELEELGKGKEKFYKLKCREMNEFRQNVERFKSEKQVQVENLRKCVSKLKSRFEELLANNGYLDSSEV